MGYDKSDELAINTIRILSVSTPRMLGFFYCWPVTPPLPLQCLTSSP